MDIQNNSVVTDVDTEILDGEITQISNDFSETYYFDGEQEEELEMLVAKAMKLGELYERKKWQTAKAQAVPEGFVLVEKSKVRTWYQDDDEPENFCNSESDLDCLGDCLDDDDIIAVNIHESAHISTRKVFGVWKSNSPIDIQSKFVLVDSRQEAEEVVASNKAMIVGPEKANDCFQQDKNQTKAVNRFSCS